MSEDYDRSRPEGLTGILDALAGAISQARAMPMSSSVLVSKAELLSLIDQARQVLPTQLTQADEVLADADTVLVDAQGEAEQIIAAARARAAELVDQQEIVHQAHARADQIVADAEEMGARRLREVDDYCDRHLGEFEIDLNRVTAQVQAARAKLAHRLTNPTEP